MVNNGNHSSLIVLICVICGEKRKMKRMKHVISIILGVCFPLAGQAQVDTVRAYALPEVTVMDSHRLREVRSVAPVQSLSREELENLHALQLSDAVKRFSGVTVKDYGGVGGLKTVSVRSHRV